MKKINIAISSCLAGNQVRYDGGHKRSKYCLDVMSDWFEYLPICPEMGVGMPTPRPPIRLVNQGDKITVKMVDDPSVDFTQELSGYAKAILPKIRDVSGYIVIRNSPSCGMERVKVYHENGNPSNISSSGIYTGELMRLRPELPIEEEGRLQDPKLRENFINRVFAYNEWQNSVLKSPSIKVLIDFHSRYKYLIMAHSYKAYKELGQLVANDGSKSLPKVIADYEMLLMTSLKKVASSKNHTNTLYHIFGYLKKDLSTEAKQEVINVIEQYRKGIVTLIVPITLLNHYMKQFGSDYINNQAYLNPHPIELGLRNYL
ncbi:DUF1722 domain-containing protein [Kangiella sp. TOML190]|uniref:YbgA family protein n=1 Tax=Kangiella sp. TOML190 TaxID=2931351 RepID=UPI00203EEABF|nr:DUF1722 domain-containing protein [Kangiella sp. TOML190]